MFAEIAAGFLLAIAVIAPIGPQCLFVINTGIVVGMPRGLAASLTAGVCDAALVVCGALGVGSLLLLFPAVKTALLVGGALYLCHIGGTGIRNFQPVQLAEEIQPRRLAVRAMAMSLLNPHAILDTIGLIGTAAAMQPVGQTAYFTCGAVVASVAWPVTIGASVSLVRNRLSGLVRRRIQRGSAVVLLAFAAVMVVDVIAVVPVWVAAIMLGAAIELVGAEYVTSWFRVRSSGRHARRYAGFRKDVSEIPHLSVMGREAVAESAPETIVAAGDREYLPRAAGF